MTDLMIPNRMWGAHGCRIPNVVLRNTSIKSVDKLLYGYSISFCEPYSEHLIELDLVDASDTICIDLKAAVKALWSLKKNGFYNKVEQLMGKEHCYCVDVRIHPSLVHEYNKLGIHIPDETDL